MILEMFLNSNGLTVTPLAKLYRSTAQLTKNKTSSLVTKLPVTYEVLASPTILSIAREKVCAILLLPNLLGTNV